MKISLGLFLAAVSLSSALEARQDVINEDAKFWDRLLQDGVASMAVMDAGADEPAADVPVTLPEPETPSTLPEGDPSTLPETPVACTMEVQECPDGSFVGRVGPDCEFEPCPATLPEGEPSTLPEGEPSTLPEGPQVFDSETIVDVAVATPNLSTLVELVTLADLAGALAGTGPFTVFAPVNSAFDAVDPAVVSSLTADPSGALTDVLLYHVVDGFIMASDLTDGASVTTLGGQSVTVSLADGVMINDANVVAADILTANGVVHLIDAVLIPPAPETLPEGEPSTLPEGEPSTLPEGEPSTLPEGEPSTLPEVPVACTLEVQSCPDGSFVGRVGPDCEFEPCPATLPEGEPSTLPEGEPSTLPEGEPSTLPEGEPSTLPEGEPSTLPEVPVACTLEVQECPDGSFVGRVGPDCEFEPCPATLPEGEPSTLPADDVPPPPPVTLPEGGEVVACTLELFICPDGTSVGRTGPNCEFEPCPVTFAPSDGVTEGEIGDAFSTSVPSDGASDGEIIDAVMCTMDVQECPDGSFVGRVEPDCDFAPCPMRRMLRASKK